MRTDLPISVVLELAASDIEVNGKQFGNKGMRKIGPHCVLGAIGKVVDAPTSTMGGFLYEDLAFHPVVVALAQELGGGAGMPTHQVFHFSDHNPQNTVVTFLRTTAAKFRQLGK